MAEEKSDEQVYLELLYKDACDRYDRAVTAGVTGAFLTLLEGEKTRIEDEYEEKFSVRPPKTPPPPPPWWN